MKTPVHGDLPCLKELFISSTFGTRHVANENLVQTNKIFHVYLGTCPDILLIFVPLYFYYIIIILEKQKTTRGVSRDTRGHFVWGYAIRCQTPSQYTNLNFIVIVIVFAVCPYRITYFDTHKNFVVLNDNESNSLRMSNFSVGSTSHPNISASMRLLRSLLRK